jgi:hypothetical protein
MKVSDILEQIGFVYGVIANGELPYRKYIYKNYKLTLHEDKTYMLNKIISNDDVYSHLDLFSELVSGDRNEIIEFFDKDESYVEEYLKEEFKHILRKGKIKKLMNL